MKQRKMKTLAWSTAVLSMALTITACSGGGKNEPASASPSAAVETASSSPAAAESATSSPDATPEVMSGVFNGMIDGHSIEIQTGAGPLAYQVEPEIAEKVSDWEDGTKIKYEYKENVITSIDKE